jgi:hypothetical protein
MSVEPAGASGPQRTTPLARFGAQFAQVIQAASDSVTSDAPPVQSSLTCGLPDPAGLTPEQLFEKLYKCFQGVAVGDTEHGNPEYPRFIGNIIRRLHDELGVKYLFVEIQDRYQSLLSPERHEDLVKYLVGLGGSEEYARAYADMIKTAVDAGVEVVAFDSEDLSQTGPRHLTIEQRVAEANPRWAEVVRARAGTAKYMLFVGNLHFGSRPDHIRVRGVERELEIPAVDFIPRDTTPYWSEPTSPYYNAIPLDIPSGSVTRGFSDFFNQEYGYAHYYINPR